MFYIFFKNEIGSLVTRTQSHHTNETAHNKMHINNITQMLNEHTILA